MTRGFLTLLAGVLLLAGCGGGGATQAAPVTAGFEVHTIEPSSPTVPEVAPMKRPAGCVPVRQGDAKGGRACVPRAEICKRGAIWWVRDLSRFCAAEKPLAIRIVSAPDELPVGATMCVVWANTPSKIREGVLVVASPHANCLTGVVGTVASPPTDPLATTFPTRRPDCVSYYPGTRRAWTAKVTFVDPPGRAWACLLG